MTRTYQQLDELQALLDSLCEESITPEAVRRLEELVLTYPEAEAYYVQSMHLHAELIRHFAALPGTTEQSLRDRVETLAGNENPSQADNEPRSEQANDKKAAVVGFRLSFSRGVVASAFGGAAVAAGLLLAVALWPRPSAVPPQDAPAEATDNSVAVLLRAPGAEWQNTGLPTRAGAPLPPGPLRLRSGLAHLQFYNGATLVVEGPAELQLLSSKAVFCARGKLRVIVPPQAQGFTVGTPKLGLVDLGTEFGLQVDGGERTEVHVFQGKVELLDPGSRRRGVAQKELTTGQGVRLDGPGEIQAIESDSRAFPTTEDVEARLAEEIRRRQQNWQAVSEALRQDPSVVVYYTFQPGQPLSRTLRDQARGQHEPRDGVIVGCQWAEGRWPGKAALEFKRPSDRVRITLPGEFDALTLMAWVRVDALEQRFNALMLTDGFETGAPHWQITQLGRVRLGIGPTPAERGDPPNDWHNYDSAVIFRPDQFGQWMHLVTVYDRTHGFAQHYVNGEPMGRRPLKARVPLSIGNAEIGNWGVPLTGVQTPIRNLNGRVDEFAIFSRALAAAEIQGLYRAGEPIR
jgi:hypothetical protein